MTPSPKWVAWLSVLLAIASALADLRGQVPDYITVPALTVATILAAVADSIASRRKPYRQRKPQ